MVDSVPSEVIHLEFPKNFPKTYSQENQTVFVHNIGIVFA